MSHSLPERACRTSRAFVVAKPLAACGLGLVLLLYFVGVGVGVGVGFGVVVVDGELCEGGVKSLLGAHQQR